MRIFYAADSSPNPNFTSQLWRVNLHDSLVALGHEVIEFRYDLAATFRHLDPSRAESAAFIAENRPRLGEALLAQIRAAHAEQPLRSVAGRQITANSGRDGVQSLGFVFTTAIFLVTLGKGFGRWQPGDDQCRAVCRNAEGKEFGTPR